MVSLFYQTHQQSEKLGSDIQAIQAYVKTKQQNRILHLSLALGKEKPRD